jgi:GntR family transcriptional regulator
MHEQVREGILQTIESRVHKVGESIPSEHELCRIYGVSRSTVRQAVKNLVGEGILATWQGKGTYVMGVSPAQTPSLYPMKAQRRWRPEYRFVRSETIPASAEIATALEVAPGSPIFFFERLRLGGGEILGVKRAYIIEQVLGGKPPTQAELDDSLIDEILARRDVPVTEIIFTVRPKFFTGADCILTDTPENTLGLQICRTGFAASGRPLRMSDTLLRSDKAIPSFSVIVPDS